MTQENPLGSWNVISPPHLIAEFEQDYAIPDLRQELDEQADEIIVLQVLQRQRDCDLF